MRLRLLPELTYPSRHAVDADGNVWRESKAGVWLRAIHVRGDSFTFLRPFLALYGRPLPLTLYLEIRARRGRNHIG